MAGGELNYVYCHVEQCISDLEKRTISPLYAAFTDHLRKVSKALHDIEWVLSGDCGPGSEDAAIRDCITASNELESAREMAVVAVENLNKAITRSYGDKK